MDSDRLCQRYGLPRGSAPEDLSLVIQVRKYGVETGFFRAALHALRKDDKLFVRQTDSLLNYTADFRRWFNAIGDPAEQVVRVVFGGGPVDDPPECPAWFRGQVLRWVRLDLPTPLIVREVARTAASRSAEIREVIKESTRSVKSERMAPEGLCSRSRKSVGAYAATLPTPVEEAKGYGPKPPPIKGPVTPGPRDPGSVKIRSCSRPLLEEGAFGRNAPWLDDPKSAVVKSVSVKKMSALEAHVAGIPVVGRKS